MAPLLVLEPRAEAKRRGGRSGGSTTCAPVPSTSTILPEAVRDTATSLGLGRPGVSTFQLDADHLPALAPQVEEAAFRIVAESLTNVARHARAGRCAVQLIQANGDLRVAITDDGCGPLLTTGSGVMDMDTAWSRCAAARPTSEGSRVEAAQPARHHRHRGAPARGAP